MKERYAIYGLMSIPLTPILNGLPSYKQSFFYPSDIIVFALALWYLTGYLFSNGYRILTIRGVIDWPFWGYSLVASLAVLVSMVSRGDVAGGLRLLKILFESCLVYYATVSMLTSHKDLVDSLTLTTVMSCLIVSAWAVYESLTTGSVPGSVFHDSELLSIYLMLVLPLAFGILLYGRHGLSALIVAITCLLGSLALFLSFSRTGWISGAVTLSILGAYYIACAGKLLSKNVRAGDHKNAKVLLGILAFSVLPCYLWLYHVQAPTRDAFFLRFMSIFSDHALGGRVELWKYALQMIQDSPLFGHGPTVNLYNLYLQTAAQFGLVALAFFLVIFTKFFGVTFGQLKNSESPRELGILMGGGLGVLGLLIGGATESCLGSRVSPLFWMQAGMVVALQRKVGDDRPASCRYRHCEVCPTVNGEEGSEALPGTSTIPPS